MIERASHWYTFSPIKMILNLWRFGKLSPDNFLNPLLVSIAWACVISCQYVLYTCLYHFYILLDCESTTEVFCQLNQRSDGSWWGSTVGTLSFKKISERLLWCKSMYCSCSVTWLVCMVALSVIFLNKWGMVILHVKPVLLATERRAKNAVCSYFHGKFPSCITTHIILISTGVGLFAMCLHLYKRDTNDKV